MLFENILQLFKLINRSTCIQQLIHNGKHTRQKQFDKVCGDNFILFCTSFWTS